MRKKLTAVFLAASMAASVLAGCGGSVNKESSETTTAAAAESAADASAAEPPAGDPVYGGTLRYASTVNCTTPGYTPECTANNTLIFLTTAYESLTYYNEIGEIVPKLAEEWTTDASEPSITWTLRSGVKFADGEPFNAEAVKRNIEEYQKCARTEVANVDSCEVIDDTHIKMVLKSWNSSTLESVGFFVYYMSPKALEDVDSLRSTSCGTGPFQVSEFNPGVSVKYKKNENYWQKGKPYLDGVEINTVDEVMTMSSAFEAGEYDMIYMNSWVLVNDLASKGLYIQETNTSGQGITMTGLIPNSVKEGSPFADQKVRQAMCYALDVEALCQAFGYGYMVPTNQWAAPGAATYDEKLNGFTYNPEKAKSLLAEAGYPNGFDTTLTTNVANKDIFTAAANMLSEVGINCEINLVDDSAQTNLYTTGTWDGIMGHYAAISPDLGLYMGRHLDHNGAFYAAGILHPQEAMYLLEKIRVASTAEEKIELEYKLQEYMYDADNGQALFGRPIFIQSEQTFKYPYVVDDYRSICHKGTWNIEDCWFNK